MPIGKDSIQKRVAKVTEATPAETVPETVIPAEKPAAPRKRTTSTASGNTSTGTKKTTSTGAKKTTSTKKPAAPKAEAPKTDATPVAEPATAVLSNVAPETVAAVIGHEEGKPSDKVKIGQKMPTYLL